MNWYALVNATCRELSLTKTRCLIDFECASLGFLIEAAVEAHGPFSLVIIGHSLESAEREAVAAWFRLLQPSTKILSLARDLRCMHHPSQYDESLNPADGPVKLIEAVKRLTIGASRTTQS